jgi:hypothetical protein
MKCFRNKVDHSRILKREAGVRLVGSDHTAPGIRERGCEVVGTPGHPKPVMVFVPVISSAHEMTGGGRRTQGRGYISGTNASAVLTSVTI